MATYILSGTSAVTRGQILNTPIITKTGKVIISSGGTVTSAIASNGGQVHISSGGRDSSGTYANNGNVTVSNGGVCMNPTVNLASMFASGGRVFSGVFRSAYVSLEGFNGSGAYFNSATLLSKTVMYVSSDAVTSITDLQLGSIYVSKGGRIQSTIVRNNTSNIVSLCSGAVASTILISDFKRAGGQDCCYAGTSALCSTSARLERKRAMVKARIRYPPSNAVRPLLDHSCFVQFKNSAKQRKKSRNHEACAYGRNRLKIRAKKWSQRSESNR